MKPGKQEEARKSLSDHARFIEENEPRMIAFHVYFDEEGNKASVVQVHPDSASMELHMQLIAEHMGGAFEIIDTILSEQYYGSMSDAISGIPRIDASRYFVANFARLNGMSRYGAHQTSNSATACR